MYFKESAKRTFLFLGVVALSGCESLPSPLDREDVPFESRHLAAEQSTEVSDIPDIVTPPPVVSMPQAATPIELYSVVVQDVPVRELLFAMARDAQINVDVSPSIEGSVSINAIDQSLSQILQRISRQIDIRWAFERDDYLVVEPDSPVVRNYQIDYVNIARSTSSSVNVVSGIGGSSEETTNSSSTTLNQSSANDFWNTLALNVAALIGENVEEEGSASAVIISPESGIVSVRATEKQHEEIYEFIETVRTRALYQVLIEATIVEVTLSDRYQSGVDWGVLGRDSGQVNFVQNLTGLNLSNAPNNVLTIDKGDGADGVAATISLLNQFGDTTVLSSPRIMALNNQTAMLRVVDSRIYFNIEVEPGFPGTATSPAIPPVFNSIVNTVPVGFTMAVTPQISEGDKVTLNVRPTISRILRFVDDPNPALRQAGVVNSIPEIQIREIESIMQVDSGQIAVLGGLMQDTVDLEAQGLPGANRLPGIGNLFNYRDENKVKTELIIFIRPVVIRSNSVEGDLEDYRQYLPNSANLNSFSGTFSSPF
ncbi:MAG: general secretion pathway protein D [Pseudohongiellaceae bacterium]|jgi:general secretion pathway protein D